MSNYTQQVSWSGKDALATSDPEKIISGDDLSTEFTAVQTALNSKMDITSGTTTGQTLVSPILNTGVSGTAFLDEDTLSSDSSTKLASQQSIKAYIDTHTTDTSAHGATSAMVGISDTQTLTNKTIVAASNTITTAATGNLTSTNINAALAELQTDVDTKTTLAAATSATAADVISTAADLVATNQDTIDTAADLVDTAADVVLTNADVVLTHADEVLTRADTVATAADVVSSSNSATAAAISAASNLFGKIADKAANYTIVANTDDGTLYVADVSGGSFALTLPSIASALEGERYGVLRSSASNVLTIVRNGSDTINGVAGTYTVDAVDGAMLILVADDASTDNWIVIPWSQVEAGAGLTKTGGAMSLNLANANTFTANQTFGPVTETKTTKSASFTPSVTAEGTMYSCSGTMTITMPTATSGKGFSIIHASASSITWAGTIKWAGGAAPTAAAAIEIYVFTSDGTNWYANLAGTGYA